MNSSKVISQTNAKEIVCRRCFSFRDDKILHDGFWRCILNDELTYMSERSEGNILIDTNSIRNGRILKEGDEVSEGCPFVIEHCVMSQKELIDD